MWTTPSIAGASRLIAPMLLLALSLACAKEDDPSGPGPSTGGSGGAGGRGGASGGSAGSAGGSAGTGGSAGSGGSAGAGGSAGGAGSGGTTSDAATGTMDGPPAPAGDASGPAAGPERFIGTWVYDSGEARLTCPGAQPLTENLATAELTFQAGTGASPLIYTYPNCNLRFDIKGQAAVVQPGQQCTYAIAGRAATSKPDVFTFTLEGAVARQMTSWTVIFTATPAAPCTITNQGVLHR